MNLLFKSVIPLLIIVNTPGIHGYPESLPGGPLVSSALPYRIDLPRKIVSILAPYTLIEDLTSQVVCAQLPGWSPTTPEWDRKMNPLRMTLCSKDFGGEGNCLYHVVSGILKENGYKIGMFDLDRNDLSMGIKASIKAMKLDKNDFFTVAHIRMLAALMYVGINPHVSEAAQYFDEKALIDKVEMTTHMMDHALDIQWNPEDCLRRLRSVHNNSLEVAKTIFDKISSISPVYCWASGDDLYSISALLNMDVLLFHRKDAVLQHIISNHKKPVCTITIYYYEMVHFQSAGVVMNHLSTSTRRVSNLFKHFELEEKLYELLPKTKSS